MLRQRILSELRSNPPMRQSSSRAFQLLAYGRNTSLFLASPKLTLRRQLSLSPSVLKPQARVLATSAPATPPVLPKRSRIARALYKAAAFTGFAALTVSGCIVAFFVYDASTYKNEAETYDVGVSALAINPRRGGPKNLPIAEILVWSIYLPTGYSVV